MATITDNGIANRASRHAVDATVEKAGMKMPSTKLLIFGNPKAGTPLM